MINKKETAFRLFPWWARRDLICVFVREWTKTMVFLPSSRQEATVPRTVAFDWFKSRRSTDRKRRDIQLDISSFWWARRDLNPHVRSEH